MKEKKIKKRKGNRIMERGEGEKEGGENEK